VASPSHRRASATPSPVVTFLPGHDLLAGDVHLIGPSDRQRGRRCRLLHRLQRPEVAHQAALAPAAAEAAWREGMAMSVGHNPVARAVWSRPRHRPRAGARPG
jgi:hypothetical protein